jgi:Domain of unknown function (DUF4124)
MQIRAILFALFALATLNSAQAQIYKWVDEKGVTHYGQKAPEGAKTTEVKISTPDEATLAAASERLAKIREELLNRNAPAKKGADGGPTPVTYQNEARCTSLRQQLAAFDSGRVKDVPPEMIRDARTRVAKEIEAVCRSNVASNANKEVECNAALQSVLAMENPQSRATAAEREAMRGRARAACQQPRPKRLSE